jgi:hypothetical protein
MRRWLLFLLAAVLLCGCSTIVNETAGRGSRPRYHPYVFAHKALPYQVFSHTKRTLEAFENDGQAFAESVWTSVGQMAEKNGQKPLDMTGLQFSKERAGDITFYVIALPRPKIVTEAYFVAATVQNGTVRYYTLESTFCPSGSCEPDPTFLCGWDPGGYHLNYGPGPRPDKEEFIKIIHSRLE